MTDSARDGRRTSRGQVSDPRPLFVFVVVVAAMAGAYLFIGGGASEQGVAPAHGMSNGAVIVGGDSEQLDEACRETFGETWESQIWVPNNPPTIVCTNGEQTGYMDMPVDIQREANIVSTQQPNGTVNFVLDDRTGDGP